MISRTLSMQSGESHELRMRHNYLTMDREDLVKSGIHGNRLKLSLMLASKGYDIAQIVLIVIYCILMVVTFLVEDIIYENSQCPTETGTNSQDATQQKAVIDVLVFLEIVILLFFVLDILVHIIGYGLIFLKDYWNMIDAVVILVNIVFVIVDTQVQAGILKDILKIRGFFRLIRIFVLIRKVNQVKAKRERRSKFSRLAITDTLELKTVQ